MQCRLDMGLYDDFEDLSFPAFSIGNIFDIFKNFGKMPSIKDLFMAKAIAGANALGLILKNLILVSL